MRDGGWTLPPEVVGHLALLLTADDITSRWRAGLIRVEEAVMNRDRNHTDATLAAAGWAVVRVWEHEDAVGAADKVQAQLLGHPRRPVEGSAGDGWNA